MTPVLRRLHEVAKAEDPGRVTTLADLSLGGRGEGKIRVSGITRRLGAEPLPHVVLRRPRQPGARRRRPPREVPDASRSASASTVPGRRSAITPTTRSAGRPRRSARPTTRAYQPEEYAAFVHERNYEVLASRPFVWGTYVWAMFDFGSGIRNEGDLRGVNTKGLVTFDRQTRKDPFYFYKANWSAEPVTHIVGRRYTDRAYATTDVKVYSNADAVQLVVNGAPVRHVTAPQCPLRTCVFERRRAPAGQERRRRTRNSGGSDERRRGGLDARPRRRTSTSPPASSPPASRRPTARGTGPTTSSPEATGRKVVQPWRRAAGDTTPIKGVAAPADAELYATYREGRFRYDIPLAERHLPAGRSASSNRRRRRRSVGACSTSRSTARRPSPVSTCCARRAPTARC